jgi:uncharacterized protein YjbI with pentapeptide repeats
MSDQQSQSDRPAPADTEQDGPDDSEPTPERQSELQAAYEANVAAGKAPYAGVEIRTLDELTWVKLERRWSGGLILPQGDERANLSGATLGFANLSGATPMEANLSGATLDGADLSRTTLTDAKLSGAELTGARMDATTGLRDARLDTHTRVADVVWNGVPLSRLNWQDVAVLGDEQVARSPRGANGKPKDKATRLREYANAVLANRQVATVLRSQGLNEHADRFAYRAQLCQRRVLRLQRNYLRYLGSLFLGVIAGYGYKPMRSFITYALVVLGFAASYFALGGSTGHPL